MEELKIPEDQIKYAMRISVLDILAVVPKDEMETKGIPFVRSMIEAQFPCMTVADKTKWATFWKYFHKQWVNKQSMFDVWHLLDENGDIKDFQARTNNALERYNRHMHQLFPSPHPSIITFVDKIKQESDAQIFRMKNIEGDHELPPMYDEAYIPELPEEYQHFNP